MRDIATVEVLYRFRAGGQVRQVDGEALVVRLHLDGDVVSLPRVIDLSAYRIIQEGLTNALKHAHAQRADVSLCYTAQQLHIEVCDDGNGSAGGDAGGHGLLGIRERVKIYGGEMSACARPTGGYLLCARLTLAGPLT